MANYTNNTPRTAKILTYDLDIAHNYSTLLGAPQSRKDYRNVTCTGGQGEVIKFAYTPSLAKGIDMSLKVQYPPFIQFPESSVTIMNEMITADNTDTVHGRVDRRSKMYLVCMADTSDFWTNAMFTEQLGRLLGSLKASVNSSGNVEFDICTMLQGMINPKDW